VAVEGFFLNILAIFFLQWQIFVLTPKLVIFLGLESFDPHRSKQNGNEEHWL